MPGGHVSPRSPQTARQRATERYVCGAISLDEFEEQVGYLIENDLEDSTKPTRYDVPPKPRSQFPEPKMESVLF